MSILHHAIATALGVLTLAGATLAGPPPADLTREYAEQLAALRAELADITREVESQTRERAVATRVIELASADLAKAAEPDARRIRRIILEYGNRLERIERDREQLEEHRAHLTDALGELERRFEETRYEHAAREAAAAADAPRDRLRGAGDRRAEPRPPDEDRERRRALSQMEAIRLALPALLEANEREAAERLELAIHLREVMREEPGSEALRELRRMAPDEGELRELLALASELWRQMGHEERAETIARMTESQWPRGVRAGARGEPRERGEPGAPGERGRAALVERVERLQRRLERIHEMTQQMLGEVEDLKRSIVEGS